MRYRRSDGVKARLPKRPASPAGDVFDGVLEQGHLHAAADRDVVLQQAVDAWAADVAAGHETGVYAWRRANVAALNQRARARTGATGPLSGPELSCPGGHAYRAGDWRSGSGLRDLAQAGHARQQAEKAPEVGARWRARHTARKEAALRAQRETNPRLRARTPARAPGLTLDGRRDVSIPPRS